MLTIQTTRHGYSLDYSRHANGARLASQFGTSVVPLPFTREMPVADVITYVGSLHPGCKVAVVDASPTISRLEAEKLFNAKLRSDRLAATSRASLRSSKLTISSRPFRSIGEQNASRAQIGKTPNPMPTIADLLTYVRSHGFDCCENGIGGIVILMPYTMRLKSGDVVTGIERRTVQPTVRDVRLALGY